MATASRRNSGAYDSLYSAVVEKWLNDNSAEDLVFSNTPTLAMLKASAKIEPLPADLTVRLRDEKGSGAGAFSYYDTVATNPIKGTQAARFPVAMYSAPLALSLQEELEFMSPQAISNAVDEMMQTQVNTLAELLAVDVFKGNASDANKINGLEQYYPAFNHLDTAGSAANADTDEIIYRWQGRQATNTYGGITRTAWTSSTDGTAWTGNSFQHFGTAFAVASGVPNAGIQRLLNCYAMASWGIDTPNVIVSGYQPYSHYELSGMSLQQIQRTGGAFPNMEMTFDNISFKGKPWFHDDFCQQYNTADDSAAGEDSIYGLNTNQLKMYIDSRCNFVVGEPRTPIDQHASVKHIVARLQLLGKNPRTGFRMFNYATS